VRSTALVILILGFTAALTAAAIEFVPELLHFPVVEYLIPGDIQIAVYKHGDTSHASCKHSAGKIADAIRANCPTCTVIERCYRGLHPEHRKILSRETLSRPSLRMGDRSLVQTIFTKEPQLALSICQQIEQQTASHPVHLRLRCFPSNVPR
jgi:hypothetical protein